MRIDISPMIRHRYASQKDIPAGGPDTLAVPSPGGDMPEEPDQISSGLSESPPPPCPGSVVFLYSFWALAASLVLSATSFVASAAAPASLGDEAHAYAGDLRGAHVLLVRYPVLDRIGGVVERAQAVHLHCTALRHIIGQDTREVLQDGVRVRTAHGGDLRQAVRHLIGVDRLAYRNGHGIPQSVDFLLLFLIKCHNVIFKG